MKSLFLSTLLALGVPVLGAMPFFAYPGYGGGGSSAPVPGAAGVSAGCTDNAMVRADGTAGATQCSVLTVDDTTGKITFPSDSTNDLESAGGINLGAGAGQSIIFNTSTTSERGRINVTGLILANTSAMIGTPSALTIADNGNGGTAATHTALPASMNVRVTCSDAQGCEWTITETSANSGACYSIYNASANNLVMKHAAGQALMPGAADVTLGQNDGMRVCYDSTVSAWLGEAKDDR